MPRLLHLAPDDKFVPFLEEVFAAAFPGQNDWRIYSLEPRLSFATEGPHLRRVTRRFFFSRELRSDLARCDILVAHSMTQYFARAITMAAPSTLVLWSGWGADYQHLLAGRGRTLLLPHTQRIVDGLAPSRADRTMRTQLKGVVSSLLHKTLFRVWERRSLGRIDLISVLPEELVQMRRTVPEIRAKLHHLHVCYSIERTFQSASPRIEGDDILVGNSAYPTNNHVEIFNLLHELGVSGRKIVVPLSYGIEAYADEVSRIGRSMFGDRFVPLRDFMPLHEYNRTIADCSTVLMNSVRQQGFGTICTTLYNGARVFLRRENPLLPYLRDRGLMVDVIQDIGASEERSFVPPSPQEVEQNRTALHALLSFDGAVDSVRRLAAISARA